MEDNRFICTESITVASSEICREFKQTSRNADVPASCKCGGRGHLLPSPLLCRPYSPSAQTRISCWDEENSSSNVQRLTRHLALQHNSQTVRPRDVVSPRVGWIHDNQGSQHRFVAEALGSWPKERKKTFQGHREYEAQIKKLTWQRRDTPMHSSPVAGLAGWITASTEGTLSGVVEQFPSEEGAATQGRQRGDSNVVHFPTGQTVLFITPQVPSHSCRLSCFHRKFQDPRQPGCNECTPEEQQQKTTWAKGMTHDTWQNIFYTKAYAAKTGALDLLYIW